MLHRSCVTSFNRLLILLVCWRAYNCAKIAHYAIKNKAGDLWRWLIVCMVHCIIVEIYCGIHEPRQQQSRTFTQKVLFKMS